MAPSENNPPVGESSRSVGGTDGSVSLTEARVPLTEPRVDATGRRLSTTEAPVGGTEASVSVTGTRVSETHGPVSATETPVSETHGPVGATDAPVSETHGPLSATEAAISETRGPVGATETPVSETDAPVSATVTRLGETGGPVSVTDSPHGVTSEAVRAFVSRPETRRMLMSIVAGKVPPENVEDLVQDAIAEAIETLDRNLPDREQALPAWLATIGRRGVADFLAKRTRRARYEAPMPEVVEAADWDGSGDDRPGRPQPSYDPREDDTKVDAWLVREWLERQVADDPRDRETLAILLEHARGGKTYGQMAEERDMTLTALSSRIFEFKGKYMPRYRRWRNRVVLLLLLGGVALVVVIVLWIMRAAPADIRPEPYAPPVAPPVPSATASTPEPFEPALPTNAPPLRPAPDKPPPDRPFRDKP
jgi:DNA-directed RNA polymerase specialized sigma24 family protein